MDRRDSDLEILRAARGVVRRLQAESQDRASQAIDEGRTRESAARRDAERAIALDAMTHDLSALIHDLQTGPAAG